MEKNLFISNFRKLPGAFLITLALLCCVECTIRYFAPRIMRPESYITIYKSKHLSLKKSSNFDSIIIGDSRSMAIDAKYLSNKLTKGFGKNFQIYNYAVPGFGIQGYYLLLRKYIQKNKAPKIIFLSVRPLLLAGHVNIEKRANEDHKHRFFLFFSIKDYFDVVPFSFFIKTLPLELEKNIFMVAFRKGIRQALRKGVLKDFNPRVSVALIEKRNGGYIYTSSRANNLSDELIKKSTYWQEDFYIDQDALYWYKKLLTLAREKNIEVVIFNMPLVEDIFSKREQNGSNKRYEQLMEKLHKEYDNVIIVKPILEGYKRSYFVDVDHLNESGSAIFCEVLAEKIINWHNKENVNKLENLKKNQLYQHP